MLKLDRVGFRFTVAIVFAGVCFVNTPVWASCGDNVIDSGEDCDDGNVVNGDCCSAACTFEAGGSPCGSPCTGDVCDGSGACAPVSSDPMENCLNASGKLSIDNPAGTEDDKFSLMLSKGPITTPEDFGDPVGSDRYVACVYDTNGVILEVDVSSGGDCDGKPCWAATKKGFKLKDKAGSKNGITSLTLKGSDKLKTQAKMKGKGAGLPDPSLSWAAPITVQLVNATTRRCMGTAFPDATSILKSTPEQFRAKSLYAPTFANLKRKSLDPDEVAAAERETAPIGNATSDARGGPNPNEIYVQSVSYGGSGCPGGSVGSSFSSDRKTLTLIFDSFVASSGPGVPVTENRKNCQLNINIRLPQGFSYSVASLDYRGYVSLPKGVTAEQKSTYYFQGETTQASAATRFAGPISKDYLVRDTTGLLTWMPCGRVVPLNINSQVRLIGPSSATAQITLDTIGGKTTHVLGIRYRSC